MVVQLLRRSTEIGWAFPSATDAVAAIETARDLAADALTGAACVWRPKDQWHVFVWVSDLTARVRRAGEMIGGVRLTDHAFEVAESFLGDEDAGEGARVAAGNDVDRILAVIEIWAGLRLHAPSFRSAAQRRYPNSSDADQGNDER